MSNKIVCIGSVVTIFDLELEEKSAYKIVSQRMRAENEISCDSILGKALMGKQKFQKVVVPVENKYIVKILEINNEGVEVFFKSKRVEGLRVKEPIRTVPNTWYITHPFQGGGCSGK